MALCCGVNGDVLPKAVSTWNLRIGNKGLCRCHWASLGVQTVKNLPAMQETWV